MTATSRHRILVVEDDDNIRNGLVALLSANGYDVSEAGDGEAGLRAFARDRPNLVLLDVMMTGLNGYDVCRAIRKDDARTPIVMLTAMRKTGSTCVRTTRSTGSSPAKTTTTSCAPALRPPHAPPSRSVRTAARRRRTPRPSAASRSTDGTSDAPPPTTSSRSDASAHSALSAKAIARLRTIRVRKGSPNA